MVGPTAVGKSDFAERACARFDGSLLNCDSVQSYALVQIGAAKPDAETRKKLPHLLWDWVEPPDELTASLFRDKALEAIEHATKSGPVFAVGGSGFYIRALLKGMLPVKHVPPERTAFWRERLKSEGAACLHQELKVKDPEAARRLSSQDGYRVARALAIIEVEGRLLTDIQREFEQSAPTWPYRSIKIGLELPRADLIKRIERRVEKMFEQGLMSEVQNLIKLGHEQWAPMKSVGYKEIVEGQRQGQSPSEMRQQIALHTAQLAKKQMTWFRGDDEVKWFRADGNLNEAMALVAELCSQD